MVMYEKIRTTRMRAGLSQAELATKAGMDVGTVRIIEEGFVEPGIEQQIRLSDILHVSIYFLRHEESQDPQQLVGIQEAMIELYRRFGKDAFLQFEEKVMKELGDIP